MTVSSRKTYIGQLSQTIFWVRGIFKEYLYNEKGIPRAAKVQIGRSSYIIPGSPMTLQSFTNPVDWTDKEIALKLGIQTNDETYVAKVEVVGVIANPAETTDNLHKLSEEQEIDDRFELVDVIHTDKPEYKILVLGNGETDEIFFARAYDINTKICDLGDVVECKLRLARTSYRLERKIMEKYQREIIKVYKQQEEYVAMNPETNEMETKTAYRYDTVLEVEEIRVL